MVASILGKGGAALLKTAQAMLRKRSATPMQKNNALKIIRNAKKAELEAIKQEKVAAAQARPDPSVEKGGMGSPKIFSGGKTNLPQGSVKKPSGPENVPPRFRPSAKKLFKVKRDHETAVGLRKTLLKKKETILRRKITKSNNSRN